MENKPALGLDKSALRKKLYEARVRDFDELAKDTSIRYEIVLKIGEENGILRTPFGQIHGISAPERCKALFSCAPLWLVCQQGCRLEELFDPDVRERSLFIGTMVRELEEGASGSLTVLASSGLDVLSDIFSDESDFEKTVMFPETATMGLFDPLSGTASAFGITPRRPVAVPMGLISDIRINGIAGAKRTERFVEAACEFDYDAWDTLPIIGKVPTLSKTDFLSFLDALCESESERLLKAYENFIRYREGELIEEPKGSDTPSL